MATSNDGCDLDIFDALAPKHPVAPVGLPEGGARSAAGRTESGARPPMPQKAPVSLSAAALLRTSAPRSAPPPPPSFQIPGTSGGPSQPVARALLAGSGKAAGPVSRAVAPPPPSSLPVPRAVPTPAPPPPPVWSLEPETRVTVPLDIETETRVTVPVDIEADSRETLPLDVDADTRLTQPERAEVVSLSDDVAVLDEEPPRTERDPLPRMHLDSIVAEPEPTLAVNGVLATPVAPVATGPLPPMPTPPSFRPASVPPAALRAPTPSLAPTTVSREADSTLRHPTVSKPRSRAKLVALLAAAVATVGIGAAAALMMPSKGTLRVYVDGPQGQDVGSVGIYVDGNKVCSSSPCAVDGLHPGIHDVYAEAAGYARTATQGVEVSKGKVATFTLALQVANSGFKVAGRQQGVMLEVDGSQVGPLPQTLTAMAPGEHKLRFVGSDRYEPLTKTVNVQPNRVEDLGEVQLDVAKGRATFELVSKDVRMRLISSQGDTREMAPQMFDDGRLAVDLDAAKDWKLQACSPGHDFLEVPLSFADGQAEKTFRIELVKNASMDGAHLEAWCSDEPGIGAAARAGTAGTPTMATHGNGTLNINSVPASAAVLLDGRPIGRTPMSGVTVSAGTHSLVFIHPEKGRKAASVTVGAGQSRGIGVRL